MIETMTVLVTIGLVVKNCEKTISDTVESIANQDFPSEQTEVVIVDDGCKDRTVPMAIDTLSKAKMKVRVFHTGGKGLGEARQMAVDNAKGKYVLWVDGDITLPMDHIRKQVEFMESHPCVAKARANWGWLKTGKVTADLQFLAYVDEVRKRIQSKMAGTGGSICRVDAIRDSGGFDASIKGAGEDLDLAIRMLAQGWSFSVSDTIFYHKLKTSWKDLWNQYFWYGYGAHYVSHKHQIKSIGLARPLPIALAVSIKKSVAAFEFSNKKISFLLPMFFLLNSLAWWIGFTRAHLAKYNPRNTR